MALSSLGQGRKLAQSIKRREMRRTWRPSLCRERGPLPCAGMHDGGSAERGAEEARGPIAPRPRKLARAARGRHRSAFSLRFVGLASLLWVVACLVLPSLPRVRQSLRREEV